MVEQINMMMTSYTVEINNSTEIVELDQSATTIKDINLEVCQMSLKFGHMSKFNKIAISTLVSPSQNCSWDPTW